MQLPRLQITESTFAKIELIVEKPTQRIEQPKAELNLRQEPAILEIKQPRGILSVDSSRARYSIGLRTSTEFSDDNASFGKQKLMEAIGRISQEGDRLAAIEQKSDPIVEIAAESIGIEPTPVSSPLNPDEGVDVSYQSRPPEIHVERRGAKMNPVIKHPIHLYTPGKVHVSIKQWNSLKFDVVGLHVDRLM
jgi:hypothetical protein